MGFRAVVHWLPFDPHLRLAGRGSSGVLHLISRAGALELLSAAGASPKVLSYLSDGEPVHPGRLCRGDLRHAARLRTREGSTRAPRGRCWPADPRYTLAALPEGRMTVRQRAAGGPEPIRDQRRVAGNGVLMVAGQKVAIGRQFKHTTLTVQSARRPWPSSFPTGKPASFDAPPTMPCAASKDRGHGPLTPQFPRPDVAHQVADRCRTSTVGSQRSQRVVLRRVMCDRRPSTDVRREPGTPPNS